MLVQNHHLQPQATSQAIRQAVRHLEQFESVARRQKIAPAYAKAGLSGSSPTDS